MESDTKKKQNACSGCGACRSICPVNAIGMLQTPNDYYAKIDKSKCINCNRCFEICPMHNDMTAIPGIQPLVYAAACKDEADVKSSASGGLFFALAQKIIEDHGMVYGAVYETPSKVVIRRAEDIAALEEMRGSKYVYSDTGDSYKNVKKDLASGLKVLYSGLPCQIAGLYAFLGQNYNNLITVELVCHGAPSPKLYEQYLAYYQEVNHISIETVNHRYKKKKWHAFNPKFLKVTTTKGRVIVCDAAKDGYLNAFINALIYRDVCYECKYATMPRNADITLGDYAGLGFFKKTKYVYLNGASQVIINSEKGKQIFEKIKERIIFEERELEEALFFNTNLTMPTPKSAQVKAFWLDYEEKNWDELRKKYLDKNMKNIILHAAKKGLLFFPGVRITGKFFAFRKKRKHRNIRGIISMCEKYMTASRYIFHLILP